MTASAHSPAVEAFDPVRLVHHEHEGDAFPEQSQGILVGCRAGIAHQEQVAALRLIESALPLVGIMVQAPHPQPVWQGRPRLRLPWSEAR